MGNAKLGCNFSCSAMKAKAGASARLAHYLDFKPVHAAADAGAKCFGARLFGSKTSSQALGSIAFAHAVGLFRGGKDPIEKALSEALEGLLDARNFNKINAAADNHAVYQANISR